MRIFKYRIVNGLVRFGSQTAFTMSLVNPDVLEGDASEILGMEVSEDHLRPAIPIAHSKKVGHLFNIDKTCSSYSHVWPRLDW